MKKILCVIFLLALTSCSNPSDSSQVTPVNDEQISTNESVESQLDIDTMTLNQGQQIVGDLGAMIEKLPNIYMQDENFKYCVVQNTDACISDFKFQNPDSTSCDDFLTKGSIEMCKITEITAQARQEESTLLCDSLESGSDSCKNEVAIAMGMKSGNVDICNELSQEYINGCKNQIITSNAINARDDALCDTLISSDELFSYEIDFCKQEVEMQLENDIFEKQQQEEQEKMQKEQEDQIAEQERQMAEQEASMSEQEIQ